LYNPSLLHLHLGVNLLTRQQDQQILLSLRMFILYPLYWLEVVGRVHAVVTTPSRQAAVVAGFDI
jgi:predicted GH43/DUF377 family glycosyl hydrolase